MVTVGGFTVCSSSCCSAQQPVFSAAAHPALQCSPQRSSAVSSSSLSKIHNLCWRQPSTSHFRYLAEPCLTATWESPERSYRNLLKRLAIRVLSQDCATCRYLGFYVGLEVFPRQQFEPVLTSIQRKLYHWDSMHLSLAGRVLVVNQVLLATAWFTTCWTLYPQALSRLCRLVRNFLWGGSDGTRDTRARVSWHTVILHRQKGGLGIIDLEMQSAALLLKLIVRGLYPDPAAVLDLLFETDQMLKIARHYEVVLLVHEDHVNQLQDIIQKVKDFIEEKKGKIHRLNDWGIRKLAYKIKKARRANYILMNIQIDAQEIEEFKFLLDKDERVIRHLVITMKKAETVETVPPPEYTTIRDEEDLVDEDDDEEELDKSEVEDEEEDDGEGEQENNLGEGEEVGVPKEGQLTQV
ncbi:hypothetical protein L7F22_010910 [Adiantum nelumboides]|nr:hypothetical protein [Adiantum nelumboides]